MKINKLVIEIHRPVAEVFLYTLNPKNTPKWITDIVEEQAPSTITKGTTYRNKKLNGAWSEYHVTELVQNKIFELTSKDENYHVRYAFEAPAPDMTVLTYTEWVEMADLPEPLNQAALENLKNELEK